MDEGAHLEDAEHVFSLVLKSEIVRHELNFERVRELGFHFKVEEVEELRQEAMFSLVYVHFVDGAGSLNARLLWLLRFQDRLNINFKFIRKC